MRFIPHLVAIALFSWTSLPACGGDEASTPAPDALPDTAPDTAPLPDATSETATPPEDARPPLEDARPPRDALPDDALPEDTRSELPGEDSASADVSIIDFTPAPVSDPPTTGPSGQPLYFFLFTHTEDQFNHALSEERYLRAIPEVRDRAAANPDARLVWTLMFQGADAETVAARNGETGVVDLISAAQEDGLVEVAYHGHHDPTYNNRPQNAFTAETPWGELASGMLEWLRCQKDPARGGCLAETGGGIEAVLQHFGECTVASGVYSLADVAAEGGPASHAVQRVLPGRLVGFGFPDHGPPATGTLRQKVAALQARMAPGVDTSPTVFWFDNVIKLNGGDFVANLGAVNTVDGPMPTRTNLQARDRTRPHIIEAGFMSKYHYTKPGTSPTIYGYQNPDDPELPSTLLLDTAEREAKYQSSWRGLDAILGFIGDNPGSRFVDAATVVDLIAPPYYWRIDDARLDRLARWVLTHWEGTPPDWAFDGEDYYSIRDVLISLVRRLGGRAEGAGAAVSVALVHGYGPVDAPAGAERVVAAADLEAVARQLAPRFDPDTAWAPTPPSLLPSTYDVGGADVTAAQLLYGLAWLHAARAAGHGPASVPLPATGGAPTTLALLEDIGCLTCVDTAWSFKPARIRVPATPR